MYRNVWRNQKNNKKLWFEEGETMQWQNEKGQDDKQWSTEHYTEN